jgi:hypothetical protein
MPITMRSGLEFFKNAFFKNNYWIIIFAVYLVLIITTVTRHEPWMDEAQPWLYGQDLSLSDLLLKYLRYDGHPPLWYLFVIPFAKSGFPYFTVNLLSVSFSALGVFLFLRYSPFPAAFKILFPFTFFIFFQYGVISRSYSLIAPVLFCIALIYKKKLERPLLFSALLCLLASISAYTFLMSGAIFIVHLIDVAKEWKRLERKARLNQFLGAALLASTAGLIILIVAQPADSSFALGYNLSPWNFIETSKRRIAGAFAMDELGNYTTFQTYLSFAVVIISLIWFRYQRTALLFALPMLFILVLFAVKYSNLWHEGILFLLWMFVLWVSFDKEVKTVPRILRKTMLASAAIILLIHVYWTTQAASYDFKRNYSGSYDAARFIKDNNLEGKKIFVSGWKTLALMPYFDKNIFYNYNDGSPHRFWFWSTRNNNSLGAGADVIENIENDQPDLVIFASDHMENVKEIAIPGYKVAGIFEGSLSWKSGLYEPDTFYVFQKIE